MSTAKKSAAKNAAAAVTETATPVVQVAAPVETPTVETSTAEPEAVAEEVAAPASREVNGFVLRTFSELPERLSMGRRKYPFDTMQPGNYFFVPNDGPKDDASKRLSTAASAAGRKLGKKFSVLTILNDNEDFGPIGIKGAGVYCIDPNQNQA